MGTPHFAYIHVYTLSMYLHGSLRYLHIGIEVRPCDGRIALVTGLLKLCTSMVFFVLM